MKDIKESINQEFSVDPRFEESLITTDKSHALQVYDEGEKNGDFANVDLMENNFSWMRGFVNCWTGLPNFGKTTFFMFMALVQAKMAGWKWCIFSPEEIMSYKRGNVVHKTALDIQNNLIYMLTGKCTLKRYAHKHKIEYIDQFLYLDCLDWIDQYFKIIQPKEKTYKNLIDNFRYFHEYFGIDGFLIDPFKNLEGEGGGRTDVYLNKIFADCKDFALETHTSFNFIAHPRGGNYRNEDTGEFRFVTQYDLAGGAAWDQAMDGIYSYHRPQIHAQFSPNVEWYNLKQRKQKLVGMTGMVDNIMFSRKQNRFFFDGVCPLDEMAKIEFKSPSKEADKIFHQQAISHDSEKAPF